jgi:hypothetical protein
MIGFVLKFSPLHLKNFCPISQQRLCRVLSPELLDTNWDDKVRLKTVSARGLRCDFIKQSPRSVLHILARKFVRKKIL